MTIKTHKFVAGVLNLLVIVLSMQGLLAILNLNQPEIYARTAFIVGLFYILQILLMYDLHFKIPGALSRARQKHENLAKSLGRNFKIWGSAFWDRIEHLRKWTFLRQWLNYLIVPGIIFWSTVSIFYIHFGFPKIQQLFAALSSLALFLHYFYLKEMFLRKSEQIDQDIFVVLSVVKIYASSIMFGAALALVKRYCLDADYLVFGIFALTFLLIWQALYQHRYINFKNLLITALIAFVMAFLGKVVLVYWGYNHFTAAVFMATCYNFMWGIFHRQLDKALTLKALVEIILVSLIILGMVVSVTNFRAQLIDDCQYELGL